MTTKVRTSLAVMTLGALTLTGCGGGGGGDDFAGKSGESIAKTAKTDMGKLETVKVAGFVTSDGDKIEVDMQVSKAGDCTGTIGFGGGTTELLGVDGSTWMRPDDAFWTAFAGDQAETIMSLVGDKWVVVPDGEDSFTQLCDLDELLDEMVNLDDDDSTYSKGDEDSIKGDDVIAIESKDSDGSSTGYVLVDDPHYLVKVERTEGDEPGEINFSEFDEDVEVSAPADDEAVDLDSLGS